MASLGAFRVGESRYACIRAAYSDSEYSPVDCRLEINAVVKVGQSQDLGPADLLNFEGKQIPGQKLATDFLIGRVKGS